MNRELLMLAKPFDPDKHDPGGWLLSEKLDGQRVLWDGGITRGKIVKHIPWANHGNPHRVVGKATGLWTRYGNVVCAPDWFLDKLPNKVPLDGELYLGRQCFQETRSIVSRLQPDDRWRSIEFRVFESPPVSELFRDGFINNPNFQRVIRRKECREYSTELTSRTRQFKDSYQWLLEQGFEHPVSVIPQIEIPRNDSHGFLYRELDKIVDTGGEGLMLRRPQSYWTPKRSKFLLKVKPHDEDVATVIGLTGGLGKYKGMLGAIIVTWNDLRFELGTGITDDMREVSNAYVAISHAGKDIPPEHDISPTFPIGSKVLFRYTGFTDVGKPREGRFIRKVEPHGQY